MSLEKNESAKTQTNIPSPCVSICALDENDICSGCYRTADEIRSWGKMTNVEKKQALTDAFEREKRVNPFL